MTWAIIAFLYVSGAATALALILASLTASGKPIQFSRWPRWIVAIGVWPVAIWVLIILTAVELRK